VIQSFADSATEAIYSGHNTKASRRACPRLLWDVARRKLDQLDQASSLRDLTRLPGNRLQQLSGARRGQHSIRINEQYRLCFRWTSHGPEDVEITDYH